MSLLAVCPCKFTRFVKSCSRLNDGEHLQFSTDVLANLPPSLKVEVVKVKVV